MSNALLFVFIVDVVVIGDGELAVEFFLEALLAVKGTNECRIFLELLVSKLGMFVFEIYGDRVFVVFKVTTDSLLAIGQIWMFDVELGDMLLIETSRGCPCYCSFCVMCQSA